MKNLLFLLITFISFTRVSFATKFPDYNTFAEGTSLVTARFGYLPTNCVCLGGSGLTEIAITLHIKSSFQYSSIKGYNVNVPNPSNLFVYKSASNTNYNQATEVQVHQQTISGYGDLVLTKNFTPGVYRITFEMMELANPSNTFISSMYFEVDNLYSSRLLQNVLSADVTPNGSNYDIHIIDKGNIGAIDSSVNRYSLRQSATDTVTFNTYEFLIFDSAGTPGSISTYIYTLDFTNVALTGQTTLYVQTLLHETPSYTVYMNHCKNKEVILYQRTPITLTYLTLPNFTFSDKTLTYGDSNIPLTASSNSSGAITYSITSGGQYASITSTGIVSTLGSGTVIIKASQVQSGSYSRKDTSITLTINKKDLFITADNETQIYDHTGVFPNYGYTCSGFVYSDDSLDIDVLPTFQTIDQNSNSGTYPIVLTGGSDNNYILINVNGVLTINKSNSIIDVTQIQLSGTVNDTIKLISISNSGGNVTYSIISGTGANITEDSLFLINEGTITLKVRLDSTNNYLADSTTLVIQINPITVITGIKHSKMDGFNIYPNPATDVLYLTQDIKGYNVLDMMGNVVISDYNTLSNTINLSTLIKGTYILQINEFNYPLIKE